MANDALLPDPKGAALAAAALLIVTGNSASSSSLPSILERWYDLKLDKLTWLVVLPPIGSLVGQIFVGWNSDRMGEQRLRLGVDLRRRPRPAPPCTSACPALMGDGFHSSMRTAVAGHEAYLPAFWTLPALLLTEATPRPGINFVGTS